MCVVLHNVVVYRLYVPQNQIITGMKVVGVMRDVYIVFEQDPLHSKHAPAFDGVVPTLECMLV